MPGMLGGNGNLKNCFLNVPFEAPPEGFIQYSLFSVSLYVMDFFTVIIFSFESNDFWEMVVHHTVTITLYAGMMMQGYTKFGVIVSVLHSESDILITLSRALS